MTTRAALDRALADGNVRAFLTTIRWCEGTDVGDAGYRTLFGGSLFEGWADHPRRPVTARLGGRPITSTAAGAYQFLARTWDGLVRQYGLPDFSPQSQDLGAVALIAGRGALADVLAGRIEDAVRRCAREWASLPGSPYGQPTKTMDRVLERYVAAGGVMRPSGMPAPIEDREVAPQHVHSFTKAEEALPMPAVAPFLTAALPPIVSAIPELGRIFSSGSQVAERNVKAAEAVVGIVQQAVGARNAQEAAEIVASDPKMAQAAREAVRDRWFEVTEAGGGGIDGARKADEKFTDRDGGHDFWRSPAFWVSVALLVMPLALVGDMLFVHPGSYAGELRVQIVTAVLAVIAMVGGYWIGTSANSARKTELLASRQASAS